MFHHDDDDDDNDKDNEDDSILQRYTMNIPNIVYYIFRACIHLVTSEKKTVSEIQSSEK